MEFMDWWKLYNRELSVRGLEHPGFREAHDLYQEGESAEWASEAADRAARDCDQLGEAYARHRKHKMTETFHEVRAEAMRKVIKRDLGED